LGKVGLDMAFGDGGGEGVEAGERNVEPLSVTGDLVWSGRKATVFSIALLEDKRWGRGAAIFVCCS